jgi:hypothetical protein
LDGGEAALFVEVWLDGWGFLGLGLRGLVREGYSLVGGL